MNNINALFFCVLPISRRVDLEIVMSLIGFGSRADVCVHLASNFFRLSQKARPPHRKKKAPVAPGGHLISIQVQRVLVELANCRRRRSSSSKNLKKDKMYY